MITDRQKKILNLIVREYSKKGEPVGSKEFSQRFFPDLSPATIRREFFDLTKGGYLIQPYTSAGRVPTDKAYKLFVNDVLDNEQKLTNESEQWQKKIKKTADSHKDIFSQSAKMIAEFCEGFGISCSLERGFMYKSGFQNLFSNLIDDVPSLEMSRIFEDLEIMDENFDEFFDVFSDAQRNVFIGKENPIIKSDSLSIISRYLPEQDQSLLVLIGSKKMDYDRNLAILEAVANLNSPQFIEYEERRKTRAK